MSESTNVVKTLAAAFTVDAVCDNGVMESVSGVFFDPEHPLAGDRQRLNRIADIMYGTIQKTLFKASGGRRFTREQILEGGADTPDDVLRQALAALQQYPPGHLAGTWEGLAVTIARNKAVDAYRASQKSLGGTEHRDRLRLVSGDAEMDGPNGEMRAPILEVLPGDWDGPEVESERVEEALVLRNLAREVLDERERKIVFAILYDGYSRKEVGEKLGLTRQRVSQIFLDAVDRLKTDPNNPFTSGVAHEGGDE